MAGLGFARDQLEKQGWKEGKGLGKEEDGITKAIKVGVKNDTQGVGYKISDQFTFHWWDHIFNKTAKSIVVNENEDGIQVSKDMSANHHPISSKRPTKHSSTPLLYGRFVKASASNNSESDSDSDSEEEMDFSTGHAEDIVFKRCGGRTAHKGARHGLKLNGKLRRIEDHDRIASSEPCSRSGSPVTMKEYDLKDDDAEMQRSYSDTEQCIKKKKRKKPKHHNKEFESESLDSIQEKKRNKKDKSIEMGFENLEDEKKTKKNQKRTKITYNNSERESTKKKKKIKLTLNEEGGSKPEENVPKEILESETNNEYQETEMYNSDSKRKKKKKRKSEKKEK